MSLQRHLQHIAPRRAPDREFPPIIEGQLDNIAILTLPFELAVRLGVRAAVKITTAALDKIEHARYLRHANSRASETASPRPSDVANAWQIPRSPRTPAAALLLGDQLLAVDAPSSALHRPDESGRCHLASRGGGLKEWLQHASPSIPYSTAMRYRRLASHLRKWLQLSPDIPLAWLFPSAPSPASLTSSTPLRRQIARARSAFCKLLTDYPSLARLQHRLETDLGLLATRCGIDNFTSYRDLDGTRSTPAPPVPPPQWNPTQTLLQLPALAQRTKTARFRKRHPTRRRLPTR